jgi:prepilin-type N-terminal cleavage/methylation domain-containing protein
MCFALNKIAQLKGDGQMKLTGKGFIPSQTKQISPSRNRSGGFTLMELMIVVAVIGILATVGGISITRELPHYRLKGDAGTIHRSFMTARTQATSSGLQFAIEFDLDASPQEYVLRRGNANSGSTTWTRLSYKKELSPGVSIAQINDGAVKTTGKVKIIFNPNGSSGQGEVRLGSATHGYRVWLTPTTGRVQVQEGWT